DLHLKMDDLREQYGDSEALSQQYIDEFMPLAKDGKVYGVEKTILEPIVDKWEESKKTD
ncbi:hypothetical protein LCGC14_1955840, partial [marine sediment metagenome]